MTYNSRPSLHVVAQDNNFTKLGYFLKHYHLAYKLAQMKSKIRPPYFNKLTNEYKLDFFKK